MKKTSLPSALTAVAAYLVIALSGPTTASASGPLPVDLLSAHDFTILSEAGITDTGSHASVITGNIGSSPITAAAMNDIFCTEMIGTIYGVDAAYVGSGIQTCFAGNPPLSNKTLVDTAVLDMETAYTDAAGRTLPDGVDLFAGNLGGQILTPGLYKWGTDVSIPTDLTLSGGINDVWIFQIAGNLDIASGGSIQTGTKIKLLGGAKSSNIFWQVGGVTGATLGTNSTFNGTILTAKQIVIQTGAILNGRAMAQTQVTLDANNISPDAVSVDATLHVIKNVVNNFNGTATSSDFNIYVKNTGFNVLGSPKAGTSTPGTLYSLLAGTYVISEDTFLSYIQSFSGDCDTNGSITLVAGTDKTCVIINTEPAPVSGGGSSAYFPQTLPTFVSTSVFVVSTTSSTPVVATSSDPVDYSSQIVNFGTVDLPADPSFPNTGLPPDDESNHPWGVVLLIGSIIPVLASLIFFSKKSTG